MTDLTYADVGATRRDQLPTGYRHVRRRVLIGTGEHAFHLAGEGLMTFGMHRAAGLRPNSTAPRVAQDVVVTNYLGIGPLAIAAPCRVVWVDETPNRVGFGYGTQRGHPERGEEAFAVSLDDDDGVWFTVIAFSKPAAWYARLSGPMGPILQDVVTRRYINAMRRLAAAT